VPAATSHTDVFMPEPMIVQRMPPPRQPRPRRGGFPFWRFLLLFVVLAAIGGRLGWFLAQPKDSPSARPTPAPVVTAAPTAPPARPTLVPTRPPSTQQPAVPPTARPTAPPTATAGPPTPTPVPPTPTALPGTAGVPLLIGKNETEAAKALHDLGLTATVREQRSLNAREGEVLAQDPKPGSQVLAGSTVTITVGRGVAPSPKPKPEGVRVPNVEGMDKEQARHALEAAGFGVATNEDGAPDRKGQVINQKPAAGDTVQPGVNVVITIGV
jgi:serine/threonine-protein kinase